MGWSAGFTLVNVGGVGMRWGSRGAGWVMAACTSTAAPSRLLLSTNSRVIWVEPKELMDVIESRPAMLENWFSSGVATAEDIVSGLAPGRLAVTSRVGKSTLGRSLTGSWRSATQPNKPTSPTQQPRALGPP